jgi:hypothetical protein
MDRLVIGVAELNVANWTVADTARAQELWADFQRQHDLSERQGQTVGIDPKSGGFWFGDSIADVVSQRDREGLDTPLFFERVGAETYWRKGGRR